MSFNLHVPSGWHLVKLSDLGEVNRGRSRHRPRDAAHLYGGSYPFIQTGDVKASGGRIVSYTQTYSEEGLAQSRLWPENTMCITIAANIAETGILTFPACFPDSVIGFVADDTLCNVYFVEYVFRLLRKKIQAQATGSVQDNINLQTLERLQFPIPDLEEQNRIAALLKSFDDKIELNRQINQILEEMAQAIFKSWFVDFEPVKAKIDAKANGQDPERAAMCAISGKTDAELDQILPEQFAQLRATAALFPDELIDSELGLLPKGWGVSNIGTVADIIDCLHSKKPKAAKDKTDRILLQLNNIGNDGLLYLDDIFFISEKDYQKWITRIEVSDGDCVITNVGRVGAVAIIPEGVRAAIGRNMTAVRLKEQFQCTAFLITLLSSKYMRKEIEYHTDIGTILNALNVKNIPKLRFVYGGNRMIDAFENMVSPILKQRQGNVIQNLSLSQLRNTLLPKLLSGEIDLSQVA